MSKSKEGQLVFVSKVSKMGKEKVLIGIPRAHWPEAEELKGKYLKVTLEEIK